MVPPGSKPMLEMYCHWVLFCQRAKIPCLNIIPVTKRCPFRGQFLAARSRNSPFAFFPSLKRVHKCPSRQILHRDNLQIEIVAVTNLPHKKPSSLTQIKILFTIKVEILVLMECSNTKLRLLLG